MKKENIWNLVSVLCPPTSRFFFEAESHYVAVAVRNSTGLKLRGPPTFYMFLYRLYYLSYCIALGLYSTLATCKIIPRTSVFSGELCRVSCYGKKHPVLPESRPSSGTATRTTESSLVWLAGCFVLVFKISYIIPPHPLNSSQIHHLLCLTHTQLAEAS